MMFLAILTAVFALVAAAALGVAAWTIVRLFHSVQAATNALHVAARINDEINARVKARVRAINAPLAGDDQPETQADVRVKQAAMVDELHEIARELRRPRSTQYEFDKRDLPEGAIDSEPPIVDMG